MNDKDTEPTVTEQARALVEADRLARVQEAARRIDELCKELRIQLVPVFTVRNGQISHGVDVVALD